MEDFAQQLERAGFRLPAAEMEQVKDFFEKFSERLKILHAADLDDEEVAGVFLPDVPSGQGGGV